MNEHKQRLAQQGFDYEQAVQTQDEETLLNTMKADALKRVKNTLIIDKIAKLENIQLETNDMSAKVEDMHNTYGVEKFEVMKQLAGNPSMLSAVSQQIVSEKVSHFLIENNKINWVSSKEKEPVNA